MTYPDCNISCYGMFSDHLVHITAIFSSGFSTEIHFGHETLTGMRYTEAKEELIPVVKHTYV